MRTMTDYLNCLRDGGCVALQIADELGVKESAVAQALKRATRKGLVRAEDGVFELTEQGKAEVAKLSENGEDSAVDLLRRIVREEIESAGVPSPLDGSGSEPDVDSGLIELFGLELALSGVGRSWLRKRRDDLVEEFEEAAFEKVRRLVLVEEGFVAEAGAFFGPDKQRLKELVEEIERLRGDLGLPRLFAPASDATGDSGEAEAEA